MGDLNGVIIIGESGRGEWDLKPGSEGGRRGMAIGWESLLWGENLEVLSDWIQLEDLESVSTAD